MWGGEWPFQVGQRVIVNPVNPCWQCAACRMGKNNLCIRWKVLGMDRVEGAFAEYVNVAATNVFPVPDDLPDARAILIEPLANGVHLFTLIERHNFGTLAIIGGGTQGCLMLALARMLGYRDIAIVDVNAQRLEVARTLGAKHLVNAREVDTVSALRDLFPDGADIVIDAHGSQIAREACVGAVKKGGEVLLLGLHEVQTSLDFTAIVRNEIRLLGSFAYTPHDFAQAQKLITNGDVDFTPWTETHTLDYGQTAFDRLTTDPGATMKIVLTP
jgi:threonine dehydrogenase-like Zn-dependent dehydrogenase